MMNKIDKTLSEEEILLAFAKFDRNNDSKISYEEFLYTINHLKNDVMKSK